jgi:hypothetical protein
VVRISFQPTCKKILSAVLNAESIASLVGKPRAVMPQIQGWVKPQNQFRFPSGRNPYPRASGTPYERAQRRSSRSSVTGEMRRNRRDSPSPSPGDFARSPHCRAGRPHRSSRDHQSASPLRCTPTPLWRPGGRQPRPNPVRRAASHCGAGWSHRLANIPQDGAPAFLREGLPISVPPGDPSQKPSCKQGGT